MKVQPIGMLQTLIKALGLISSEKRSRWVLLVMLAITVSLLEVAGAFFILVLLRLLTEPTTNLSLPVVGSIDALLPGLSEESQIMVMCAVIGGFFLLRGFVYMLQSYSQNRISHNAGSDLASRLFSIYLRMPYVWHLKVNSTELVRNINATMYELVNSVFVPSVTLISEAILVLAILTILVLNAPLLTLLVAVVIAPLVLVLVKSVQPRLASLGAAAYYLTQASLQSLQQSLDGLRDIKVLGRERFFLAEFSATRREIAHRSYLRALFLDMPRVIIETVLMLFILGFLALTIIRDGSGSGTLALLGLFAYAVLRLMPSINRTLTSVNALKGGTAAIQSLHEHVMLESLAVPSSNGAVTPVRFEQEIRFDGVSFAYDPRRHVALEGIDLIIRRGEFVGIVGSTGSGKSTLVDVLVGLLAPTSGRVTVDDVDIQTNLPGWHDLCGIVPQSVFLIDASLRSNIALGVDETDIDPVRLTEAISVAQLESFVESLPDGLDTRVGERGVQLSGGQRQRVAIARAVYVDPALLILDEGTSALDNVTEREVIDSLRRGRSDRTIVSVAHRLTTVKDCDQIVVLSEGRVSEVGTYDELRATSPTFREMIR